MDVINQEVGIIFWYIFEEKINYLARVLNLFYVWPKNILILLRELKAFCVTKGIFILNISRLHLKSENLKNLSHTLQTNNHIGNFFFKTAATVIQYYVSVKRLKIMLTSVTAVNGLFLWHLIRLQLIPDINFPLIKDTIMFC